MRYRVLGPLEVDRDGAALQIPRRRERCLLGVLLLNVGRFITVDRLIDLLWEDPPEQVRGTLRSHVARIRAVVCREDGEELVLTNGAYALRVDPDQVDVHVFRAQVAEARAADDLRRRFDLLGGALGLWRGDLMQDSANSRLRERIGGDVRQLRLDATEEWLAAGVDLGRHHALLPELAKHAAEHPARERAVELHMIGLRRSGREADALAVYSQARSYLVDELGLEPGQRLRDLQGAILRQETDDAPATHGIVLGSAHRVPAGLPTAANVFVGRSEQLGRLDALTEGPGIAGHLVAVVGAAGVGKTALAVTWGHAVRRRFPDGQLYVNMHGYSAHDEVGPAVVLGRFLRALKVPPDQIPSDVDEAAALYRSVLAGRRMLVVLDNVRRAEQVRPLLPSSDGCVTVVTSRDRLDALVAIDGAARVELDVLALPAAVELLTLVAGADRTGADVVATRELAQVCGRLPLALRITAAHLVGAAAPGVAEHLATLKSGDPLAALAADDDPSASVKSTLDFSYRSLPEPAARLFRLLGLSPALELEVIAIAAMAGLPEAETASDAGHLRDAHLAVEARPGRFSMHDLVRLYAHQRAVQEEPHEGRREALVRLVYYYADTAIRANAQLVPQWTLPDWKPEFAPSSPRTFANDAEAMTWFSQEQSTLWTLTQFAADEVPECVWPLTESQTPYLVRDHQGLALVELGRLAAEVAGRMGRDQARAAHANAAAIGYSLLMRPDEAIEWYEKALEIYARLGMDHRAARVNLNVGALCAATDRFDRAVSSLRLSLDIARRLGDRHIEANALGNLGFAYLKTAAFTDAVSTLVDALEAIVETGNVDGECRIRIDLGAAYVKLGDHAAARTLLELGIAQAEELGDRLTTARGYLSLGDVCQGVGAIVDARREWHRALDIFVDISSGEAEEARQRLAGGTSL